MIRLRIKTPGLYIDLTGVSPRRTPTEIDISKCNLNTILTELKAIGVDDFEILSIPETKKKYNIIKRKEEHDNINDIEEILKLKNDLKDNSDEFKNKINGIENLLRELLENQKNMKITTINQKETSSKKSKEEEQNDIDFIPEVNLSGMKFKKKGD